MLYRITKEANGLSTAGSMVQLTTQQTQIKGFLSQIHLSISISRTMQPEHKIIIGIIVGLVILGFISDMCE